MTRLGCLLAAAWLLAACWPARTCVEYSMAAPPAPFVAVVNHSAAPVSVELWTGRPAAVVPAGASAQVFPSGADVEPAPPWNLAITGPGGETLYRRTIAGLADHPYLQVTVTADGATVTNYTFPVPTPYCHY